MSKIILHQPNYLFNYSNIGHQRYLQTPSILELMEKLHFETMRLGEVTGNIQDAEPLLRNADIVSFDISAIRWADCPGSKKSGPNGLYGEEACQLSRYAGISDKLTSVGFYEYNTNNDIAGTSAHLIAQMIWYFIEGVNFRVKDYPFSGKENYQKFTVLLEDDEPLLFYKSNKSGRWWMEINILSNNKYKRHALIPCTYNDYKEATKQNIPERWYKAMRKML